MKVLKSGAWVEGTPKGVLVGGAWKTPAKISVLKDGAWVSVWPPAIDIPPYLYDCTSVSSTGWVVDFTVLDGWPEGDVNEAYMFRCSTLTGFDGYVGRKFQKTFRSTAYSKFNCTLEDLSNIPGKERKTISFTCSPRA
jgi:hypothetical protein